MLMYAHHFAHHGGSLLGTLAHAVVWSAVARFIWHAPVLIVLALVAVAALYLLRRRSS